MFQNPYEVSSIYTHTTLGNVRYIGRVAGFLTFRRLDNGLTIRLLDHQALAQVDPVAKAQVVHNQEVANPPVRE